MFYSAITEKNFSLSRQTWTFEKDQIHFIAWGKFSSLHDFGKQKKRNKDNKSLKTNNYSSFQFPALQLISFLSLLNGEKHQTQ